MPEISLRNVPKPLVNEGLLSIWGQIADNIGVITPVASVAAAYALLTQMETAGVPPTPTNPLFVAIGSAARRNLYCSDGTKGSDGVWVLQKVDEVESKSNTYDVSFVGQKQFSAPAGGLQGLMISSLPARPYARTAIVDAAVWGKSISGNVDLQLSLHGGGVRLSRFTTDDSTVSVHGQCMIPAGESPLIKVSVLGGSGGGRVELSSETSRNSLDVIAFPISMT